MLLATLQTFEELFSKLGHRSQSLQTKPKEGKARDAQLVAANLAIVAISRK